MVFQKVLKSPKKLAIKIWTCFSTTTRKIQCTQLRNVASAICRWLSYERKVHARFNAIILVQCVRTNPHQGEWPYVFF